MAAASEQPLTVCCTAIDMQSTADTLALVARAAELASALGLSMVVLNCSSSPEVVERLRAVGSVICNWPAVPSPDATAPMADETLGTSSVAATQDAEMTESPTLEMRESATAEMSDDPATDNMSVLEENPFSAGATLRAALKQGLKQITAQQADLKASVLVWLEPDQPDLVRFLPHLSFQITTGAANIVAPAREHLMASSAATEGCSAEVHAESFGNAYINALLHRLAPAGVVPLRLDWFFGSMLFRADLADYWLLCLQSEPRIVSLWLPVVDAICEGEASLAVQPVSYCHAPHRISCQGAEEMHSRQLSFHLIDQHWIRMSTAIRVLTEHLTQAPPSALFGRSGSLSKESTEPANTNERGDSWREIVDRFLAGTHACPHNHKAVAPQSELQLPPQQS
mmetsp:Transcript_32916/g.54370  ORF Transcript_32916/g.54370 Transcript_32916/m.54370 type:complete len:398 (+) Transcript_32916:89-1282(+)